LWLAYGLALGFTAIVTVAGLACIHFNKASYNNSFSTVMRTSRGADLDIDIAQEDASGASPLPPPLASAKVYFQHMKTDDGRVSESPKAEEVSQGEPKQPDATSTLIPECVVDTERLDQPNGERLPTSDQHQRESDEG
jgi:hypothetical protein